MKTLSAVDAQHGAGGSDFDKLGLGAETLTHWVDARFNYYAPDNVRTAIGRSSSSKSSNSLGPEFTSSAFISRNLTETGRRRSLRSYEAVLEGYNAEIGFLIPGLDRFAEVRVFGGYYHYDNPFEGNGDSFTPRRREFRERMGDMVIRSHRIQAVGSGDLPAGDSTSTKVTTVPVRPAFQITAQKGGGWGSLVE